VDKLEKLWTIHVTQDDKQEGDVYVYTDDVAFEAGLEAIDADMTNPMPGRTFIVREFSVVPLWERKYNG